MKLSIVTTLYRSAPHIAEFHRRMSAAALAVTDDYEIIYVNDGSPDDSLARVKQLADTRVVIVDLSRNFGHHKAMRCGLQQSRGEFVFLIDVDLEEAPENLAALWQYLQTKDNADVVIGKIEEKEGGFTKRAASDLFYVVFNTLSSVAISNRELVSRLMRRTYVDTILQYGEREMFFPGIWAHVGFQQDYIPATKAYNGNSTYTLKRRLALAVDAITSFSSRPLFLVFYAGCIFSLGALVVILYLILNKWLFGGAFQGWSSLVAIMFFIGGIIIFSLGLLGVYVARIYEEVKQRPSTIIKKIYRH